VTATLFDAMDSGSALQFGPKFKCLGMNACAMVAKKAASPPEPYSHNTDGFCSTIDVKHTTHKWTALHMVNSASTLS
jgi:hypothetical protein